MNRYPLRRLGDLLELSLDAQRTEPTATYKIAGVYSFGRGLFGRDSISGSETSYSRLHCLHENTLVLSRLKAFEGAVTVVPPSFAGWFVSPEFPTFRPRLNWLDSAYLAHLCRWPSFWGRLREGSKGIGARRERLHPEQLFEIQIPAPDISEQCRISAKLTRISRLTSAFRVLADRADALQLAVPPSLSGRHELSSAQKQKQGWRKLKLGKVIKYAADEYVVDPLESYPNVGILSFGRGLFSKPPIDGASTSARKLYRIRAGQFIYSRLFAFEGAYGVVAPRFDGHFVSNEFPTFDIDETLALPSFLGACFQSPSLWSALAGSSRGLGVRRQRIHPEAVLGYELWLPPLTEQSMIETQLNLLWRCRQLRRNVGQLFEALEIAALNRAFSGKF